MKAEEPRDDRSCEGGVVRSGVARREFLLMAAGAGLGLGVKPSTLLAQDAAEQRPTAGDELVPADDAAKHEPLRVTDVPVDAKPIFALPRDAASGTVRDGSKLNRVLLVRLAPETLEEQSDARATGGVMAFSAICTHEGCAVSEWVQAEQCLLCVCHFSKFDVRTGGAVADGPAPRGLPRLPLRLEGDKLVVDGGFSSAPGVRRST